MRYFPAAVALTLGLVACSDTEPSTAPTTSAAITTTLPATTAAATTTEATAPPTTQPEQCITLRYEGYAQIELVAPEGTRVLIDIGTPARLSSPAVAGDILLTTHTHWDHLDEAFQASFPGQQLMISEGTIDAPGVHIQGLASVHRSTQRPKPEGGYNYLYVVEMAGLRIAHFGDIGQDELTPEQLTALGAVDIVITQFANPYSDMDSANRKGFHLMEQLAPRLIVPTHLDNGSAALLPTYWPGAFAGQAITVCPSGLPATTEFLLLSDNADGFAAKLQLAALTPTDCVCADG